NRPAPPKEEGPSVGDARNERGTRPVEGGVINGRAISKPAPPYPAIAKVARADGAVAVHVVVNEQGDVISARATAGHPLLQAVAVEAASQAKFTPTTLSGRPVKVSGVITYNFVLQ
ncbi:MAG TPA: energy transducer TonB, partial [Pyrinomonadaceae bacterium]